MTFGFGPTDLVPFFFQRGVLEPTRFALAMLVLTLSTLVTIRVVLERDRPSPIDPLRIATALSAGAAVAIAAVPILVTTIDLNPFGLVQIAWNGLVFAVAPVALSVLVRRSARARLTRTALLLSTAGLLIWPAALYARFIEPYRLEVERVRVEIDANDRRVPALRIGVLADLQTDRITPYERQVVDRLLSLEPDVILIPGDLFQGSEAEFRAELGAFNALLRRLEAPLGVFFVTGDVDLPTSLETLFEGTSIRRIDDRIVRLEHEGVPIELAGFPTPRMRVRSIRPLMERWREASDPTAIRIAMAHHPDPIARLEADPAPDLFIAGHTHGGQIALPFLGPPVTLSSVPRSIGAGGLHRLGGRTLYVSRGAGMERGQAPRIRFLCPPEVTLLELVPADPTRPLRS